MSKIVTGRGKFHNRPPTVPSKIYDNSDTYINVKLGKYRKEYTKVSTLQPTYFRKLHNNLKSSRICDRNIYKRKMNLLKQMVLEKLGKDLIEGREDFFWNLGS